MALYQSCRNLWDCTNSMNIPVGTYVETECVKWVARFGQDLRKLGVDEKPIPGVAIMALVKTVEDTEIKVSARKFIPPIVENKTAVVEEKVVETE